MKLPSLSFFKKQAPKEYYLALLLQEELLRAVVFEESNGVIHVIGEGMQPLPELLSAASFETLLDTADKAISQAENSLPDGIQSHKTIFGVQQSWTENLQISKDHLGTLKKLCDELDLQPIGFLVFPEAVAHLLQNQEGAPVSGIFIELGNRQIVATLLRAGRVINSATVNTAENLPKAVDSLLAEFSEVEILPSRIILLDTEKRENITKQFNNHSWSKSLPFLHVPQITALPEGFEAQAILFGTATQMGFALSDMPRMGRPSPHPAPLAMDTKEQEDSETTDEASEKIEEPEPTPEPAQEEETQGNDKTQPPIAGDNFGFVKDQDVLASAPSHPGTFHPKETPEDEDTDTFANETFADIPEEVKEDEEKSTTPGIGANAVMVTEGMKNVFGRLKNVPFSQVLGNILSFPKVFFQGGSMNTSRLALLAIPLILVICILGIVWYMFGVKATATLLINPEHAKASQSVTFSTTDATNLASNIIGGTIEPIQEDGKVSTNATGKKDVGDKAKGTITIYNNDDSSHTINSGTTVTSSNGLKFVTNDDVTVASASGDIFSGTTPGTKDVNVTAADIGTDYNLPSGTKFAFGSSTIIAAKNSNAFSGGTKKSVTVVSQADLDTLTKNLTSTLGDKAKQDMQQKLGGKTILPLFLSTDVSNKTFDHVVGDETSTVNLSATISYQAFTYNNDDAKSLAQNVITKSNSNDTIDADHIAIAIQNPQAAKDGKSVTATLAITGSLLPKIDTTQVAQRLAGKSFDQATRILSDIPNLASVNAVLSPHLFFLPRTFPRMASHITVGVASNE